jgi:hypothetical protein
MRKFSLLLLAYLITHLGRRAGLCVQRQGSAQSAWPIYTIALASGFRGKNMDVIVGKLHLGPRRRVVTRAAG